MNFSSTDRLVEAAPKPLGQDVPEPIHERLKQLCDLVYEAGESRRQPSRRWSQPSSSARPQRLRS